MLSCPEDSEKTNKAVANYSAVLETKTEPSPRWLLLLMWGNVQDDSQRALDTTGRGNFRALGEGPR